VFSEDKKRQNDFIVVSELWFAHDNVVLVVRLLLSGFGSLANSSVCLVG
jgi:hypothetical protein